MARPSKLTPERAEEILSLVRAGNYPETAAKACGVSPAAFYNWKARGEEHRNGNGTPERERRFVEFVEGLEKAESEAEARAVQVVVRAGFEHWQAAMTYLERKYPERWGRRERYQLEHSGSLSLVDLERAVRDAQRSD